jgi:hypothetical protein
MGIDPLPVDFVELIAVGSVEPAVSLDEFFSPTFMRERTQFEAFAEFRAESPWTFEDRTDVDAIPTAELDDYVARTTEFDSWLAMRNATAERAVIERLMA